MLNGEGIDYAAVNREWRKMEIASLKEFEEKGVQEGSVMFSRHMDMRYRGQEHTVKVTIPNVDFCEAVMPEIIERFHVEHMKNYSFRLDDNVIEIVNLHLTSFGKTSTIEIKPIAHSGLSEAECIKEVRPVIYEGSGSMEVNVYDRLKMPPDMKIMGPAIIEEASSSVIIYPGMDASIDLYGNIILNTGVQ